MNSDILFSTRARLHTRLERAAEFPVLVVCAPAGFGKTTVLREFFAARKRSYRALELAPNEGELLGFMRAFATCVADLAPAMLASVAGVYDRMEWGDRAADSVAAWAAAHLEGLAVTFVVDDLEKIADERLFVLLNAVIDRTASPRIRWVLVCENADRFPIARWLANAQMDLPIDDVDLAITCEDLVAAVRETHAAITAAELQEIWRASGDWPAALALALSTARGGSFDAWDARGKQSYAHFAERAFAARSQRERRFLLETCVYRDFDRDLLEAAGWTDVEPIIADLLAAGAILFASGPRTYRYHEVFRAFLEQRLRADRSGRDALVRHAAALVYRRLGRWSDALDLYLRLAEPLPLADLLSEHGFDLLDRGEATMVAQALDLLGEAEFSAYPVALAVKASLESLRGSFDVAEAWFAHAIDLAAGSNVLTTIILRLATDLVRRDRRDAIDLLEPIVRGGGHALSVAVSLAGLLATAYATHGQSAQAASTIEEALGQLADVDDPAVRAKLYFQAGYVAFFARNPDRAKAFALQALQTASTASLYDIAARSLSILYSLAMDYDDDVRGGRRYLDALADYSIKAGNRNLFVYATLAQFELEVFCGDLAQSARLDAALGSLEVGYSVLASETLLPAQALRATWSGDFARAFRLIAPTAETQITPSRRAQRYAEIALYAAAGGLRVEAGAAITHALAIVSGATAEDASTVCTLGYAALALNLLGRHRRAAQVLSRLQTSTGLTPRFAQLREAIVSISARLEHGSYGADLRVILERLEACGFGGIGRLIEALPLRECVRPPYAAAGSSADVG